MLRAFLKTVPIPTAGLALGVIALGKLLGTYIPAIEPVCALLALALILLVTARIVMCPRAVAADLAQPVQAAVFGTFFMTYMQLATYLPAASLDAARVLWVAAVIGHFALMVWFTVQRVRNLRLEDVYATWFVCYVGIIVASVTSPAVQLQGLGRAIFWFGFVAYLALLVIVTVRHARLQLAAPAAPTFCIYAAPMSLSIAGYLSAFTTPSAPFVLVLELAAQALLLVVLFRLPRLLRGGFFPSFAAMTFPFVITATALTKALALFRSSGFAVPAVADVLLAAEVILAAVMTTYVFVRFMGMFMTKMREIAGAEVPAAGAKGAAA